jgi:AraC-like DNA-binding protein
MVKEVAYRSGSNRPNYFGRQFKGINRVTPREYQMGFVK